mmetsp:Transcript_17736/g.43767  ORF Transcript_17736/g.43767 Transcript_17736/m.43767 type:complete len:83 (-) Transcript_17736:1911-2159(-)
MEIFFDHSLGSNGRKSALQLNGTTVWWDGMWSSLGAAIPSGIMVISARNVAHVEHSRPCRLCFQMHFWVSPVDVYYTQLGWN